MGEGGLTVMNIEISLEQVNFVVARLMALLIILETMDNEGGGGEILRSESALSLSSLLHQYPVTGP